MYQVYTHPKYIEYGKKFFEGVNERYTEYAKLLEPKIGIPYTVLTPLIFILIRACVHYAMFEDEYYLKSQTEILKQGSGQKNYLSSTGICHIYSGKGTINFKGKGILRAGVEKSNPDGVQSVTFKPYCVINGIKMYGTEYALDSDKLNFSAPANDSVQRIAEE